MEWAHPEYFNFPDNQHLKEVVSRLQQTDPKDIHHHRTPILFTNVANKDQPSLTGHRTGVHNGIPFLPSAPVSGARHAQILPIEWQKEIQGLSEGRMHQRDESFMSNFNILAHPSLIVGHVWSVFQNAGSYVMWNVHDFKAQFHLWDGTLSGLLTHIEFLWRMFVIGVIVVGLVELEPLLAGLWHVATELGHVLWMAVGLVETATEEIWSFLNILIQDAVYLFHWVTGNRFTSLE
jgi:hypothetical protein